MKLFNELADTIATVGNAVADCPADSMLWFMAGFICVAAYKAFCTPSFTRGY